MLCQEYRQILSEIPYAALVNKDIDLDDKALNCFYRYFDLANGQFYMARCKRIRAKTWDDWRDGIRDNFQLVAFRRAWREIEPRLAGRKNSFCVFCGLRWLINTEFKRESTEFKPDGCKGPPCKISNCGSLPEQANG
jgi:hypothetical protein